MNKLTKSQKKKVQKLLDKMDWEGGVYEYFTSYTDVESVKKEFPFLPEDFFTSAQQLADSSQKVENFLENLRESVEEEE